MNKIRVGIINESTKLFYRRKYQIFLLCIGILIIVLGLINNFTESYMNISLSNLPLNILSMLNNLLIPLISFIAVADLFTAEQKNGTIKALITRPIKRNEILISKMLSILIYLISILSMSFFTGTTFGIVFGRTQVINIPQIFIAYAASSISIIPTIFFSILISQLSNNGLSSIIFSVLVYVVMILIVAMFPLISKWVFISYANWYKLFIGTQMSLKTILRIIGLFIGYSLLFFSGSYALFEKREY